MLNFLHVFVFATCALFFAEVLSWWTASIPPCLIQGEHKQQAADHNNQEDCPTFFAGSVIIAHRVAEFIRHDDNDKVIVAAFTIVLAVSTIGLWLATIGLQRSTNRLWEAGERQIDATEKTADAAVRSAAVAVGVERPILYVVNPDITFSEDGGATATFTIINLGRTPAILEYAWYGLRYFPEAKLPESTYYNRRQGRRIIRDTLLPERGVIDLEISSGPRKEAPYTRMNAYLMVVMYYSDVFGTFRKAGFLFGWPKQGRRVIGEELRRLGRERWNYDRIESDDNG
jgi:hypothetical protein